MNATIRCLLAAVLLTLACLGVPGLAQEPQENAPLVGDVVLVGNRKVSAEMAFQYIRTQPGRKFSPAQLRDDVARLSEAKLFMSIGGVKIEQAGDGRINVVFEVKEHPNAIREVVYRNLECVSSRELYDLTKLQRGMPLDPGANQQARRDILDHLKKRGHYFAKVTLLEGQDEDDERVVFRIDEGPQVRVRDVRIVGQGDWTSAEELAARLDTRKAFIRPWGDFYRPESIEADEAKLVTHCREHGFFEAAAWHRLSWSEDFAFVDVAFHLKPGQRYTIGDWTLDSNGKLPRADLARLIQLKKGDFCDAHVVRADNRRLADWGGVRGKRLGVTSNITEIQGKPGVLRVHYTVEDAPVDYVGEVYIVGNTVTQDQVIRREIGLLPGQILDYTKVRAAQENLCRRGIFRVDDKVFPTVSVLDNQGKFKDILVKVEETKTGSLTIGCGFNTEAGPVFGLVLEEHNFDPWRWPTNWADVEEGRAFRGAGHYVRFDFQRMALSVRPAASD